MTIFACSLAYNCLFAPRTQVDVSSNNLGPYGKAAIGNALLRNLDSKLGFMNCDDWQLQEDVTTLNVADKKLTAEDAVLLAGVLAHNKIVTQVDVRSNNLDENIGQIFIPIIEKPHFESFSGIPVKKIRDNAITEIDVKGVEGRKLEACGGVILAHCLKSNSSVTVVEVSNCGMGTAGAKAFGDVLRVNKTLQRLNVSNNSFGRPVVGDQVKLKSSGEMCPVEAVRNSGNINITKSRLMF